MKELEGVLALIDRYGLPLVAIVVVSIALYKGWLRIGPQVDRELGLLNRLLEISEKASIKKDEIITALTSEVRNNTEAVKDVAAGIKERNVIESTMRGRRT